MIIKSERYKPGEFTKVSVKPFRDPKISWGAKGLLIYMLSYPSSHKFDMTSIQKHSPEGETALRTLLKELISAGYLKRERISEGGRFLWVYTVSDSTLPSATKPQIVSPPLVSPPLVSPPSVSPPSVSPPSVSPHAVDMDNKEYNIPTVQVKESTVEKGIHPKEDLQVPASLKKSQLRKIHESDDWSDGGIWKGFSSEEKKIVEWASNSPYWEKFVRKPASARALLDSKRCGELRADYQTALSKRIEEKAASDNAPASIPKNIRDLLNIKTV